MTQASLKRKALDCRLDGKASLAPPSIEQMILVDGGPCETALMFLVLYAKPTQQAKKSHRSHSLHGKQVKKLTVLPVTFSPFLALFINLRAAHQHFMHGFRTISKDTAGSTTFTQYRA
ncbi:hypothetical protein GCM10025791_48270 [Halioxenophilus aromaticivorans]|uniref:Uncharacterized protein n=2 Tax=Halioxenophilus aromaticivorans TaxID=1306992 RepID=A0AAV3U9S3_9ALTE